ncbi:MAG: hypothetical protein LBP62_03545 [Clostridiales bacterium]|jgi:hypothetical protein|nr:hypothetical protein [Clostridiales bacterium]
MAVLENATRHYYRILFDRCEIKDNFIMTSFLAYKNSDEREKEKQRESLWTVFFNNVNDKIDALYQDLIQSVTAQNLLPENILSATEENKIDGVKYPALRQKQDVLHALEKAADGLQDKLYIYEYESPSYMSDADAAVLMPYGFDKEWVTDPIVLVSEAQVDCGVYAGEELTNEFYYNKLKKKMSGNIANI